MPVVTKQQVLNKDEYWIRIQGWHLRDEVTEGVLYNDPKAHLTGVKCIMHRVGSWCTRDMRPDHERIPRKVIEDMVSVEKRRDLDSGGYDREMWYCGSPHCLMEFTGEEDPPRCGLEFLHSRGMCGCGEV